MKIYNIIWLLISIFLDFALSGANGYKQIKDFGRIVITANETLYLDLNDYFEGNISQFSVSDQDTLHITPKLQQPVPISSGYAVTSEIIALDISKDTSGDWILNDSWIFLDNNNTVYSFQYDPNSNALTNNGDFSLDNDYKCGEMYRVSSDKLAVSCLENLGPTIFKAWVIFYNISENNLASTQNITYTLYENVIQSVQKFSGEGVDYLITYSICNQTEGKNKGVFASIYSYSSDNDNYTETLNIGAQYFNQETFCLQGLDVINTTVFFADFGGTVYRVENPQNPASAGNPSFSINDNILKMAAVSNSFEGQVTTTVAIESATYIYHFDWTDPNNAILINKYSLSPLNEEIESVAFLDISQDFVSTVVSMAGSCNILTYYLGQSLPEDTYYMGSCPTNTSPINMIGPQNIFLFLAETPSSNLNVAMYQVTRSLLTIKSTTIEEITPSLYVNNDTIQLQITIIDPQDMNVSLASSNDTARVGLTVPGQSTFEITGLLNGPLITYQSNDSSYNVVPNVQNIAFNISKGFNLNINFSNPFASYSPDNNGRILWISYTQTKPKIDVFNCTKFPPNNYSCPHSYSTPISARNITSMAVSPPFVFYIDSSSGLQATNYMLSGQEQNISLSNCTELFASQSNLIPFVYCVGDQSNAAMAILLDYDDLTNSVLYDLNFLLNFTVNKTKMQVSSNFPSLLFLQNDQNIYILDAFELALSSNAVISDKTIISTIQLNEIESSGFDFALGGQSLLVLISSNYTLLEYDISHPSNPLLIKMVAPSLYAFNQFLSDSQNANNIYIYAQSLSSLEPTALVYEPQMPGNSVYLTEISLPDSLFDTTDPSFVAPRLATAQISENEILLLPYNGQLGWLVSSKVEVSYSAQGLADSDATDYEETAQILFTGSSSSSSAVGQVSVDLLLSDERAKAIESLYYDPNFKMSSGLNIINIDPRNYFNGSVLSYSFSTQETNENNSVTLNSQISQGVQVGKTSSSVYDMILVNGTVIAQLKTSIEFFFPNASVPLNLLNASKSILFCDNIEYNDDLQIILSTCFTNQSQYSFVLSQYTANDQPTILSFTLSSDAGKTIENIQKTVFTSKSIFILESIDPFGDFIHVFDFNAPSSITYVTSITGADLSTDFLAVSDFTINYKGDSNQYRLFLVDSQEGLRIIDVEYSGIISFQNPQIISLPGPPNVIWNGILTVNMQGDLTSPIDLFVTSSNFKNYFLQYTPGQNITIKRTFISAPNTTIMNPCYADGQNFIVSASNNNQAYGLLYSISNISSIANGQNFPLMSNSSTSSKLGACSFTFDRNAISGPTFYIAGSGDILNYTVSPYISLAFTGVLKSSYITIYANSIENHQDSFQFYLVAPSSGGINWLIVLLIVGGIALLIIIALICYCTIKYKKRKRIESDSYYANLPQFDPING